MIKKWINQIKAVKSLKTEQKSSKNIIENNAKKNTHIIHKSIETNMVNLKTIFNNSIDIKLREFYININKETKALICFIDGLVNKELIDDYINHILSVNMHTYEQEEKVSSENIYTIIQKKLINASEIEVKTSLDEVIYNILSGQAALFIDNCNTVITMDVRELETRNVEEPDTETVIRGSREGFVEALTTNTSLIRRKINNPNLVFECLFLGKQTHTRVCISYIKEIADEKIIHEVKNRLNSINTDSILESGYIEQFIDDHPLSPFPTIGNSEKPDKVAAKLLEGRVAILCDGTPFVLTVPYLFIEPFQASEDYSSHFIFSSFIRSIRLLAFFITLTTPALYVAVSTFHQEMIPTVLLITTAAAHEGIPFSSLIEVILMLIIFEILRESGIRMPRHIGQAVSIVGALIIGEAAVNAGIISAPMVIITALTGITSFIIPALLESISLYRIILVLLSATFGLFGTFIGLVFMLGHLCSLKSFGSYYLQPFAPTRWEELKDTLIRVPIWFMKSRPKSIVKKKSIKQDKTQMPKS